MKFYLAGPISVLLIPAVVPVAFVVVTVAGSPGVEQVSLEFSRPTPLPARRVDGSLIPGKAAPHPGPYHRGVTVKRFIRCARPARASR